MSMDSKMQPETPSSIAELLQKSEANFPTKWRADCWYLTVAAALVSSGQPNRVGTLYSHLVAQERYSALIKCIPLVGIPTVIEAVLSIVKVENPQDRDYSFTRIALKRIVKLVSALAKYNVLYIAWISTEISYGFFLAEHRVLDITESEFVILPAIMCQNLKAPTMWHQRGCLRVGITRAEVRHVQKVSGAIASFGGRVLDKIGDVDDVLEDPRDIILD
ncbi:hypothetical protein BKA61DRAFT_723554 [Leptodontidium sp. MPI-SDFR-AT-0119]|nr:hypothetical protein BKA61DRAFT_723554 [Leptodontidium sp. MPI-SDFR-AT-0119]